MIRIKTGISFYFFALLILIYFPAAAQTITGIVRDSKDNSPLPFVTIEILESKTGTARTCQPKNPRSCVKRQMPTNCDCSHADGHKGENQHK